MAALASRSCGENKNKVLLDRELMDGGEPRLTVTGKPARLDPSTPLFRVLNKLCDRGRSGNVN